MVNEAMPPESLQYTALYGEISTLYVRCSTLVSVDAKVLEGFFRAATNCFHF